jgi:arginine N-succinyltransferase
LPKDAQDVIGKVHPNTEPARKMLEEEGFEVSGTLDIFTGAPVLICPLKEVRAARESVKARVAGVAEIAAREEEPETYILANPRGGFRACLGPLEVDPEGGVTIPKEVSARLYLQPGDQIRYVRLRPGR